MNRTHCSALLCYRLPGIKHTHYLSVLLGRVMYKQFHQIYNRWSITETEFVLQAVELDPSYYIRFYAVSVAKRASQNNISKQQKKPAGLWRMLQFFHQFKSLFPNSNQTACCWARFVQGAILALIGCQILIYSRPIRHSCC